MNTSEWFKIVCNRFFRRQYPQRSISYSDEKRNLQRDKSEPFKTSANKNENKNKKGKRCSFKAATFL